MFFFLTYFILYNRLQFHPPRQNWLKCILFNSWVIFHCVYVPHLPYPFVCRWTSRLLPCPGYYKQYCDEHWGTCVSFNSSFLGVYAQQWDYWVVWQFCFLRKSPLFSIVAVLVCIPTNSVRGFPFLLSFDSSTGAALFCHWSQWLLFSLDRIAQFLLLLFSICSPSKLPTFISQSYSFLKVLGIYSPWFSFTFCLLYVPPSTFFTFSWSWA